MGHFGSWWASSLENQIQSIHPINYHQNQFSSLVTLVSLAGLVTTQVAFPGSLIRNLKLCLGIAISLVVSAGTRLFELSPGIARSPLVSTGTRLCQNSDLVILVTILVTLLAWLSWSCDSSTLLWLFNTLVTCPRITVQSPHSSARQLVWAAPFEKWSNHRNL